MKLGGCRVEWWWCLGSGWSEKTSATTLAAAGVRVLAGLVLGCAVGRVSVWVRLLGAS